MIYITYKAIVKDLAINVFLVIINSLFFSSALLLYGWIDMMYLYSHSSTLLFFKFIVSLFVIMVLFSMFFLVKYTVLKRGQEFNTYLICGSTQSIILRFELVHFFILTVVSEIIGSVIFILFKRGLSIKIDMNSLGYIYVIFILAYMFEVGITHLLNTKELTRK